MYFLNIVSIGPSEKKIHSLSPNSKKGVFVKRSTTQPFTQLRFTQNQIYTALHWHIHIYTTQIYTKLNPNLHRPKFTQAQIYIHIFGQISSNPNSHNPNLHKTQIYTTQIYATQIYTKRYNECIYRL